MSEPFVFDPRSNACKTPFGAVSCGETVTFSCRPLLKEGFTHCALVLHHEFLDTYKTVPLSAQRMVAFCFPVGWKRQKSRSLFGIISISGGIMAPAVIWINPAIAATDSVIHGN